MAECLFFVNTILTEFFKRNETLIIDNCTNSTILTMIVAIQEYEKVSLEIMSVKFLSR